MRLYMPRIRIGTRAETLFRPRRVTEEEVEQVLAVTPFEFPDWLILPDVFLDLPSRVQIQIMMWVQYFTIVVWRSFGKVMGPEVFNVVNQMTAKWVSDAVFATTVQGLVGFVLPWVTLLATLYIVNPVVKKLIWEDWEDFRYLGRYEEKMFFFDHVGTRLDGRPLYLRCSELSGQIVFEHRSESTYRGVLDHWWLENTWVQERREELFWRVWVWGDIWAEYVGFLTHVEENVYILNQPAVDPWAQEMPAGWVKDPALWCVAPGR